MSTQLPRLNLPEVGAVELTSGHLTRFNNFSQYTDGHEMITAHREFAEDVQILDEIEIHRFPKLGATIQIIGERGDVPQINTHVPRSLFAKHFEDADWSSVTQGNLSPSEKTRRRHSIRNQLQIAGFSLEVLERQSADGDRDLLQTLEVVIHSLKELEASC